MRRQQSYTLGGVSKIIELNFRMCDIRIHACLVASLYRKMERIGSDLEVKDSVYCLISDNPFFTDFQII